MGDRKRSVHPHQRGDNVAVVVTEVQPKRRFTPTSVGTTPFMAFSVALFCAVHPHQRGDNSGIEPMGKE